MSFPSHDKDEKFKEALADLSNALTRNPQNENALSQRAKLNMRLGRCEDSEKDLISLKRINPKNKEVGRLADAASCKNVLQEAQRAFKSKQWSLAKHHLTEALRFTDISTKVFMQRSWCYFYEKDYFESIADSGRVLKIEADNLEAFLLRGKAYFYVGELELARTHFRAALQFDPELKEGKEMHRLIKKISDNDKKAKAYEDKKQFEEAIKHLTIMLEACGDNVKVGDQARKRLAEDLRHLKRYKEAKEHLQQVSPPPPPPPPSHSPLTLPSWLVCIIAA
eukprot:scaffold211_cov168-Ochromonas_danica.AAC.6